MPNLNIDIPDQIYGKLKDYQDRVKPHLSMKAILIEAVTSAIDEQEEREKIFSGSTQIDPSIIRESK